MEETEISLQKYCHKNLGSKTFRAKSMFLSINRSQKNNQFPFISKVLYVSKQEEIDTIYKYIGTNSK